jgi:hypothetical protein
VLGSKGLPPNSRADVQIFTGPATTTLIQWVPWQRPLGRTMLDILCIGGGGAGGAGFTGIAGAARGGGGGGGCSGVTRVIIPLSLLPKTLWIQAGNGGKGGTGAGGAGVLSAVSIHPVNNNTATNLVALSGAAAAGGGGVGTGAAGGAGGTAGSIATIGAQIFPGLGHFAFIAGVAGSTGGGVNANGISTDIPVSSCLTMPGSGGGGCTATNRSGGACNALAGSWLSEQRPATAAAGQNAGSGGKFYYEPIFSFPGMGAGSSNTTAGGNGGNAAYGSGGGGGGAGTTGGVGGDGGAGIVILTAW